MLGALAATTGCASFAPGAREPMRVGNTDDLSPADLAWERGRTRLDEAAAELRERGATGVARSELAEPGERRVGVLGADYQSRVHVFLDGAYAASLDLPRAGFPPYGLAAQVGRDANGPVVVVLFRDPLARPTEAPRLVAWRLVGDAFERVAEARLGAQVARHGGMIRPQWVGGSFDRGAMLVARDRRGQLWDRTYLVRVEASSLSLSSISTTAAMRCSCVEQYAFRPDALRAH
jgi:hypothetical protein